MKRKPIFEGYSKAEILAVRVLLYGAQAAMKAEKPKRKRPRHHNQEKDK